MLEKKEFYKIQELAEEFASITGKKISTTKRAIYRELERGQLQGVKLLNSIMIPYENAMSALKGRNTFYEE